MSKTRIRALLFSTVVGFAATLSPPAQALPIDSMITYYSDATYTIEVGWRRSSRCGENYDIGKHSPYRIVEALECPLEGEL